MSSPEKKMDLINAGRRASLVEEAFGSLISDQKQAKMKLLTQEIRGMKVDHDRLVSIAAAITALEDLEEEVKRRINRSMRETNDLLKGAQV